MTSSIPTVSCPIPQNQSGSLAVLRSLQIMDAQPEASLNRIVRLAARVFNAPMAFISLMDADRQRCIAQFGGDWGEITRSHSFCARAMLETKPMVVCNPPGDERFREDQLVTGQRAVYFYAGASLRTSEGLPVGTLCVVDSLPRDYPSQGVLDSLSDLAFLVMEELEFRWATAAKWDVNEQELRRSLHEKETLLQEVHHRVKNNLQIVSSLLKLQADSLSDPAAAALLRESQQRVLSMALIHERLYAGKEMAAIEFDSYARTLVQELVYSYAGRAGNVTGRILPPPIFLTIGQAIPCALILNELVTNALKYAYPAGGTGEVVVELQELPDNRIRLAVSDHGTGLPEGFDFRTSKSLGLRIVWVLAKQLGGTLTIERGKQTKFALEFPREELKGPGEIS